MSGIPELHHLVVRVGVPGTIVRVVVPPRVAERTSTHVYVHDQLELHEQHNNNSEEKDVDDDEDNNREVDDRGGGDDHDD